MSQKTLFTKSALAVAVALISTQAWSAGFQLNEFSSSGLGRAYSGEGAIADDAGNLRLNMASNTCPVVFKRKCSFSVSFI